MTPSMLLAAAALGTVSGQAVAPPSDAPITLATETTTAGVTVRVVGRSPTPVTARYQLEMTGDGNRTVQRGAARLRPGETTTLMISHLGGNAHRHWTARLTVEAEGRSQYEINRGS